MKAVIHWFPDHSWCCTWRWRFHRILQRCKNHLW